MVRSAGSWRCVTSSILLGWGLGHGVGYAVRLREIAVALARRGHRPVVALRDVQRAAGVFAGCDVPVVPAPYARGRVRGAARTSGFRPTGLVDLMACNGFDDPPALGGLLRGWQGLIDVVRPSVVVAEYAPTLWLAAYGRVPRVIVTHGYTAPPVVDGRVLRLDARKPPYAADADVLRVVQQVQRSRGAPAPEELGGVLEGEARFILTVPELDPYRSQRAALNSGPLSPLPSAAPLLASARIYAYLAGDYQHLEAVLRGLADAGVPGAVYVRDDRRDIGRRLLAGSRLAVLVAPPSRDEAVAAASVVVSHASVNTVQAALGAGRPQLLVPSKLDQAHVASAAVALGVGVALRAPRPRDVARNLRRLLWEPAYIDRAVDQSHTIRGRVGHGGLVAVVDRCEELAAAG